MFAIIESMGRQYKVAVGDVIRVDLIAPSEEDAPAGVKITKAGLKSLLSNGIAIFAGRTCGQCSPSIDEADFSQCDHPEFTAAKLASTAPLACQAYDGMSCSPVEISELTCSN